MKTDKKMGTENKKAFIHISDLHVVHEQSKNKDIVNRFIVKEKESTNAYIESFCAKVLKIFKNYELYLLVTGDIIDKGEKDLYEEAGEFMNKIIEGLKIDKKNVLIVPGNHDVSVEEYYKNAVRGKDLKACENAKYAFFKQFYKNLFEGKKKFSPTKQIVDHLELKGEKILIVGINTNYEVKKEPNKDDIETRGGVNDEKISTELQKICEGKEEYLKIAIFHHNCGEEKAWKDANWNSFSSVLQRQGFGILMFGNEHSGSFLPNDHWIMSGVSSFGKRWTENNQDCSSSFKSYEFLNKKGRRTLRSCVYIYASDSRVPKWGLDSKKNIVLQQKNNTKNNLVVKSIPENETNNQEELQGKSQEEPQGKPQGKSQEEKDVQVIGSKEFQDQMMSIIKSERLFHPGHFHRGKDECSRTHHWIDTISLLNKKDYRDKIQKELQRVYDGIEDNKKNKFDAIIGVGMEGNVMSTILQVKDIYYTYTPYPYRDNFNEYEKGISFLQEKYENVLIITDVINEGKMLKDIIEKEKDFNKVTNIYVVSLFYTGKKEKGKGKVLDELTRLVKEKGKTIDIRSLIHLEVGKCLYADNENFKEECEVYKHELCEIYKF